MVLHLDADLILAAGLANAAALNAAAVRTIPGGNIACGAQ
jgi:hypothetical protein